MQTYTVILHENLNNINKVVKARNAAHAYEVAVGQEERAGRLREIDIDSAEVRS